jgi:hypothetical protein
MRALLVGSIALLITSSARADMLGPGEKSVSLSIRVDATVPAGKTLVLANSFRGADIIKPGEVQKVEWHPLGGAMQLRMIDSKDIARIEAARANLERDKVLPIVNAGPACGEAFPGVRTLPESSPADEVRWTFRAKITGKRCEATLASTEYFDKDGKAVDPAATAPTAADMREPIPPPRAPGAPPEAPPAGPEVMHPAPPAPAPPPAPASAPAPTPAPASGGCHIGDDAPLSGVALALLLVTRRRRLGSNRGAARTARTRPPRRHRPR